MRMLVFALSLWLNTFFVAQTFADDSPIYAVRGMSAYKAGKYELAKMFFTKALQDAVLKGNEDWVVKATLNLVDLNLEMMDDSEASRLLEGLTTHNRNYLSLILWKKSQVAYDLRQFSAAISLIDSALKIAKVNGGNEVGIELDRLRYLIQIGSESVWRPLYLSFNSRKGKLDKGRVAGLDALVAMSQKEWGKADTLWQLATNYYRDKGRLAKVASGLNQSAVCKFSLGHREDALETNQRAVSILGELGLEIPGLKAQALRLLLIENPSELAKIRKDMDLLGQRLGGFDLQGILDEYSRSLQYGRIGIGP